MRGSRRLLPVLLLTSTVATVAGCGAGSDAETLKAFSPGDGVGAESGRLRVLNALVVEAEGATSGVVSMSIANRGSRDDALTGLTSKDGSVALTGDAALPAGKALHFGASTGPSATVTALQRRPGEQITLRLTFRRAEPVMLHTVVVPATGPYTELTPAPTSSSATTTSVSTSTPPSESASP